MKPKKATKKKYGLVMWEDSWSNSRDQWSKDEFMEEPPITLMSLGFIIQNDKKGVGLADQYNPTSDEYRFVHFIPRGMIRKVDTLEANICELHLALKELPVKGECQTTEVDDEA